VEQEVVALVIAMQACLEKIQSLKESQALDARSLAVAATQLETAMLWVANAR
jgi:hypothetical protein